MADLSVLTVHTLDALQVED